MLNRNRATRILLAVAAALLAASCATTPPDPAKTADGVLVSATGMTLYTFDRDVSGSGKSVCNGPCAALWPPFTVAGAGESSVAWQMITRDDGSRQWAYLGKPLYTYSKDMKPGEKSGDGFNNVWKVAKP